MNLTTFTWIQLNCYAGRHLPDSSPLRLNGSKCQLRNDMVGTEEFTGKENVPSRGNQLFFASSHHFFGANSQAPPPGGISWKGRQSQASGARPLGSDGRQAQHRLIRT